MAISSGGEVRCFYVSIDVHETGEKFTESCFMKYEKRFGKKDISKLVYIYIM